jgi:hypothetical protein
MQHQIYFCNRHLKRMKHTVVTCAHLLATIQWRLVDVMRGSAVPGTSGSVRHRAHVARDRSGATVRGARCRGARARGGEAQSEARDARGASFFRKVRVMRCRGEGMRRGARSRDGSVRSGRTDVLIGALL